jgi:hypothetical protein
LSDDVSKYIKEWKAMRRRRKAPKVPEIKKAVAAGRLRPMRPVGETGFRGVRRQWGTDRFEAQFKVAGVMRYLGGYATAEEAAAAYDRAVREVYGPDAPTNFGPPPSPAGGTAAQGKS